MVGEGRGGREWECQDGHEHLASRQQASGTPALHPYQDARGAPIPCHPLPSHSPLPRSPTVFTATHCYPRSPTFTHVRHCPLCCLLTPHYRSLFHPCLPCHPFSPKPFTAPPPTFHLLSPFTSHATHFSPPLQKTMSFTVLTAFPAPNASPLPPTRCPHRCF